MKLLQVTIVKNKILSTLILSNKGNKSNNIDILKINQLRFYSKQA